MKKRKVLIIIIIFLILFISSYLYFRNPYLEIVYNNHCGTYAVLPDKVTFYNIKMANEIANVSLNKKEYNTIKKDINELKEKLKDYDTTSEECVDYIKVGSKKYLVETIEIDERISYLILEIYSILHSKQI